MERSTVRRRGTVFFLWDDVLRNFPRNRNKRKWIKVHLSNSDERKWTQAVTQL